MSINIEDYLILTRGKNNFVMDNDSDIQTFIKMYESTLFEYSIKVVTIKSSYLKTELIDFGDSRYLIWDTSFFENVSKYINNILQIKNVLSTAINTSYTNKKMLCEPLMSQLWKDLLNSQICNINCFDQKQKNNLDKLRKNVKQFYKYCSQNFCSDNTIKISKYLYSAKHYIFSHELAHITYKKDIPYLNKLFETTHDILKQSPTKPKNYEFIKGKYELLIDNSDYKNSPLYNEILADTRAVQTVWTKIINELFGFNKVVFNDQEIALLFPSILEAQDGIDLVRSYLVQSTNLRHMICSIVINEIDDGLYQDFVIRDCFSNIIIILLLCGFDNNTGRGKNMIELFEEYRHKRNIEFLDDLFSDAYSKYLSNFINSN